MTAVRSCPNREDLQLLASGKASDAAVGELAQHVLDCNPCLQTLDALRAQDTLLAAVRDQAKAPPDGDGPVQDLIERVQRLGCIVPLCDQTTAPAPEEKSSTPAELLAHLAPPQGPDELGRLGPYRLLEVLGSGGMGMAFKAEDTQLRRLVALKLMKPAYAANPTSRQRFLREAQLSAAIEHEHIVPIYQVGEANGVPYLAMKLLQGETLEDRLKRESSLSHQETLRIGREIAEGLAAAHERGLIHRDVKPANVFLTGTNGQVKLLDFGLARSLGDDAHLTGSGVIAGTPAYMAPEQAQSLPLDPRCDLFSLGCVLYRMTTGRLPFQGSDVLATLRSLAVDTPAVPRTLNQQIPAGLSDLITQLLAKDRAARPASAAQVSAKLAALLQPPPAKTTRPTWRAWVAAACLVLVASVGLYGAQLIIRITDKDGKSRDVEVKEGAKVEILQKPPTVPAPVPVLADNDKPFILLRPNGQREEFKFAREALVVLQEGDVLEVHGNGPFNVPGAKLEHGLTVRAGLGYRPFLRLHGVLEVKGPLLVEDCDIHSALPGRALDGAGPTWEIRRCRLFSIPQTVDSLMDFSGRRLTISECLIWQGATTSPASDLVPRPCSPTT